MPRQEVNLGIIGTVNILVLTLITLVRTIRFLLSCSYEDLSTYVYQKKLVFHLFLLLASASDLPYYFGLMINGQFSLIPYSFHRFETAFLFAAFSITISDWGAVLYDINEYKLSSLIVRKATLVSINAVYMSISLANFVLCYTLTDMDKYLESPLYITSIFFQIGASCLLTCFMLSAGLKLSWRIQGAAGVMEQSASLRFTRRIRQVSVSSVLYRPNESNLEFRNALRNLNMVMGTCTMCVLLQAVMLTLNYALGYSNKTAGTVGPVYFYWTCYNWLPVWGIVLSLLYLSRAHAPRRTFKSDLPRSSVPSFSNNACIGGEEDLEEHEFAYTSGNMTDNALLSAALLGDFDMEASSTGSSGNYLRGGFSGNSYPPERTGSRDTVSVASHGTMESGQHLQLQQHQLDRDGLYSPDNSMSYRESYASTVVSPMIDMYSRGGGPERTFSED